MFMHLSVWELLKCPPLFLPSFDNLICVMFFYRSLLRSLSALPKEFQDRVWFLMGVGFMSQSLLH